MADAPSPGAAYQAPPPVIPGYRDVRLHRRGSSAEVYRATMERLGFTVAIKLLRLDEMTTQEQFQQELTTVRRLAAQPHVVRILDAGTVDGRPYLAMEFCEDGSYAEIVVRHGPLSIADTVDVGIKIAEALHGAHELGLIHRDVTPGNILRSQHGPALADFGIARRPAELSGTVTLNKLTPHHAAPEALQRQPQSISSDVYSLGSTLWHLLAGHPPFAQHGDRNPDPFTYREQALHRTAPLVPRPDVPVWLQTEIARALNKRPEDRHPSAAALGEALRRGWDIWKGEPWTPPASYPPLGPVPHLSGGTPSTPPAAAPADAAHPPSTAPPEAQVAWMRPSSAAPVSGAASVSGAPQVSGVPPTSGAGVWDGVPHSSAPPGSGGPQTSGAPSSPAFAASAPVSPAYASAGTGFPTSPAYPTGSGYPTGTGYPPEMEVVPEPEPPGRRVRFGPFVVAGVIGVVLGVLVFAVLKLMPSGDGAAPRQTAPHPTPSVSVAADKAPTDVKLDDKGASIVVSWHDHTGGTAPHYVVGGPEGASPRAMTQAEKGVTEVSIDGLNPKTDYCFTVIAVVSVDEVAPGTQTCTHR